MIKKVSLILILLYHVNCVHAQDITCKVLHEKIAGEYVGNCQNGLANGKGKSKGVDSYSGMFKDGLPNGKGKYVYSNGNVFKGYFKSGCKEGKGKFEYTVNGKKQILNGYWKNDEYVGQQKVDEPYRVTLSSGILNYSIKKVEGHESDQVILFSIKSSMTDFMPDDLEIRNFNGQIMQLGKKFTISHYQCPFTCEINYSIKTGFNQRKMCQFIFDVSEKGKYEIVLSND
ncbi:hypothetical protein GCQ56_15420 [Marinifilum sp. N1E240]|uniref:hypothetical protein n=1 Tax=Marinifilum sp. N1E240 TaxID=2608082 RepID=UPI00128C3796|nr:hypothetical protein [Marinifilum sp. N1E240]MPQ48393.1 hypothetical protein [Marinifilum sp. N1E240]